MINVLFFDKIFTEKLTKSFIQISRHCAIEIFCF